MIHLIKYAALKLWATTVVLVIASGIVVAAARLLLPLLADYRGEIERLLSEETGLNLRIGGVAARLDGFAPELVLTDLAVRDPDNKTARLQVAEVEFDFDVVKSLITGRISLEGGTIAGARLALTRLPDGSLTLTGLQGIEETGVGGEDSHWFFLKVDELRIVDGEVSWHDQAMGAEPVQLSDVHVLFENDGDRHRTHARARIAGLEDAWIQLIDDFHGDPAKLHTVTGYFHIKGANLALDHLLGAYEFERFRIESGTADVELWAHMDRGVVESVTGKANLRQVGLGRVEKAGGKPVSGLMDVRGGISWQRQMDGWQLDVQDLEFVRAQRAWPTTGFSVRLGSGSDAGQRLRAGFEFLRVQDLVAVGQPLFPADTDLAGILAAINIQADLHGLQLVLDKGESGVAWSARGRVNGLHTQAWKGLPGISGLDLMFWADQDHGTAELQSRDVALRFPGLFRDPLSAAELSGRGYWQRHSDGKLIAEAPLLVAHNSDIRTQTRLHLVVPGDDGSAFLDLQTDFQGGKASAVPTYLPVGTMSPGLVDWLDQAFVSGRIKSGTALVRGPLDDFPFKKDEGRFEASFSVGDLILDYFDDWPRLEDLVAEVRFLNDGLSFRLTQGYLLASSINLVEGRIQDLERTSPLKLEATLNGPLSDYLRVLSEPPLSAEFGDYVKDIQLSGQARTQLTLSIPIDDGSPLEVKGKLSFDDASLRQTHPDIRLFGLQGKLEFSQDSIWCSGVRAQTFGIPIVLDVDTIASDSGQGGVTRISARGVMPISELARRFPDLSLQYLEGVTQVDLRLDFPHRSGIEQITAELDLTQVAVNLPPPLGKAAGREGRLTVSTELSERPVKQVNVKYGDDISAALVFALKAGGQMRLERGVIRFGPRQAQPRHGQGFWLEGSTDVLDLDAWLEWSSGRVGEDRMADSRTAVLRGVDLEVGQLLFNGETFSNVDLDILRTEQAWTGYLSTDLLAGNLYLPHDLDAGPLVAKLEYLNLSTAGRGDEDPAQEDPPGGARVPGFEGRDLRELPGLDLNIKELRLNGKVVGQAELKSERVPTGQHMTKLSIDGPHLKLSGSGYWVVTDDTEVTEVILILESDAVGKLLEDLGYEKLVKKAPTKIDAALRWPGAPHEFALAEVAGTLSIETDEGRLLDVGPGFGRVFGLINFGALQRRLSLDFSDLFGEGFGFDKIKASFLLKDGDAHTDDAFIEGPAARIDMSGRTGLVARDYDQKAVVTPRVSGSIPVAGALAGGPVVGAALLVAQQIVGKEFDRMTRYQYAVTGSWEDPVFTREKSDDGWSLSHLFGPRDEKKQGEEDQENTEIGHGFLDH